MPASSDWVRLGPPRPSFVCRPRADQYPRWFSVAATAPRTMTTIRAAKQPTRWAIPGGLSLVDMDFDGVADFCDVADLGGQVCRANLNPSGTGHTVHRIAELGGSGSDHRRFYEAPAVAYVKEGVENHFYVAVAS